MPLINGQTSTRGELPESSSSRWGSLQRGQRKTKLRLQRHDRRERPRCLQCLLLRNRSRIRPQHASLTYVEQERIKIRVSGVRLLLRYHLTPLTRTLREQTASYKGETGTLEPRFAFHSRGFRVGW